MRKQGPIYDTGFTSRSCSCSSYSSRNSARIEARSSEELGRPAGLFSQPSYPGLHILVSLAVTHTHLILSMRCVNDFSASGGSKMCTAGVMKLQCAKSAQDQIESRINPDYIPAARAVLKRSRNSFTASSVLRITIIIIIHLKKERKKLLPVCNTDTARTHTRSQPRACLLPPR